MQPGEQSLTDSEQRLLDRINEAYYLPAWCSISDYRRLFEQQGLTVRMLQACLMSYALHGPAERHRAL